MNLFRKKELRHSPTLAEVQAEAAAFRAESASLREDMSSLRSVMTSTTSKLDDFAQAMKGATS